MKDTTARTEAGASTSSVDPSGSPGLARGSLLMAIAGLAFVGYGLVFLLRNFAGSGFELGVDTINGVDRAQLDAFEPAVLHYISHLHVATAAFIIATGIAVAGLAWYGVRRGHLWAWAIAVAAPVTGLGMALPMHWFDLFGHDWLAHLGPVYLATAVFVVGALQALGDLRRPDGPRSGGQRGVAAAG